MKKLNPLFISLLLTIPLLTSSAFTGVAGAQPPAAPPSPAAARLPEIAAKTVGMQKFPGYFPYYWDATTGKIWLEVDKWDTEFLYVNSLASGVGSNDIGLDRGQLGRERIVKFTRSGPKVLLLQPNYSFRAVSPDANERRAVEDSFAQSVLGGFTVAAESGDHVLVDFTDFLLRDAHDVSGTLQRTQQGIYSLDINRSAIYLPRTKNFPKNSDFETLLTFAGKPVGAYIQQVTPSPEAVTVRQHHSFVELPGPGYTPRPYDPRSGYFDLSYYDYATPIDQPLVKRLMTRHRLQKKDPKASISEPVKPIVYYVDPGAPEQIRSALLEGARWWNQAFEAAGYKDAFRVEVLPADADPMDIRYNVIQWVHRSTRGWSYGSSVVDPRTGEIIKGHVTLGSLRLQQDYLIAQGLVAAYEAGKPVRPEMLQMALARLRQLAAHEVGHTLGLAHNYAASTNNRASVMDYPHPYITLDSGGKLDFSKAYTTGIGEWDKRAILYGYQDFPTGTNEAESLDKIVRETIGKGLLFITDQDARPQGSAHPQAHLWDGGSDPVVELRRLSQVRSVALANFGENNLPLGAPMATLEEVLAPLYLAHRYQVEAVAKVVGGVQYTYAVRGDGQTPTAIVPSGRQRDALTALLETLKPQYLVIPERILRLIPPHPPGYERTPEIFDPRTGSTLDPLSAAESAAGLTLQLLLNPARAARMVEYQARDSQQLGFDELLARLIDDTWFAPAQSGLEEQIQQSINLLVLHHLMALVANDQASGQVRALALRHMLTLKATLQAPNAPVAGREALRQLALLEIARFERNPADRTPEVVPQIPAGSPIGDCGF